MERGERASGERHDTARDALLHEGDDDDHKAMSVSDPMKHLQIPKG